MLPTGTFPHRSTQQTWRNINRQLGADEAALMSNGSGDEWAVVFTRHGAFIRVFAHESAISPYRNADRELWPGLVDGLPAEYAEMVAEPAFADEDGQFLATAVLWRGTGDDAWKASWAIEFPRDGDVDGAELLSILDDDMIERYAEFATDCYEREIEPRAIAPVVEFATLTDAVIAALNPDADPNAVRAAAAEFGYPV